MVVFDKGVLSDLLKSSAQLNIGIIGNVNAGRCPDFPPLLDASH